MTIPTHRLAAIIFTDISGYTSLMGEDEAMAMNIMKRNRDIHLTYFDRFNCTYHKQMGDGFLAVFNSLSEAIYASAHIMEETQKLNIQIRIGIHEGDIIFQDNDVYGDGVNIAARLEQSCVPGSIYVSESVKRNVDNKNGVSATFIKEATLKNVREPLRIYEITVDSAFLPKSLPRSDNYHKVKKNAFWKISAILIALIAIIYFIFNSESVNDYIFSSHNKVKVQLPGNSIAVLPFENQGIDDAFDYLGAGIADGILTKLSMLNDFTIVSRSSSFNLKTTDKTLAEIAQLLGVSMILEGSFYVFDDEIRINAKLVDIQENRNLLAETYKGKLKNIFNLQDEASEGLYKLLGKSGILPSSQKSSLQQLPSMPAYKHYQEGLSLIKKEYVYPSDIEESRILFQNALSEDPSYFEPLIALSETFLLELFYGYNSISIVKDSIEKYISRANEINPGNGQLSTIKGAINFYEFNYNEAKELVKQGIILNPNYPFNYFFLSWFSIIEVDRETQLQNINKAISLDPLNSQFQTLKIIQSIFLSDFSTAASMIDASLRNQPGNNMALFVKGLMLCQQKKYQDALDVLLSRSVGDTTNFLVAYAQGKVGNTQKAEKIIHYLVEKQKTQFISPTTIALAYLGLGNKEKAVQWLEESYDDSKQDAFLFWTLLSMFEPLHQDQRFIELLNKFDLYATYQLLYEKVD